MKKRLCSLLMATIMLLSLLPATAFATETGNVVQVDSAQALKEAVEQASDNVETTIQLTGDISGMTTEQIVTIPAGKVIVLDMQGHSITVDEKAFQRRPFVNYGTFTITGNGTVDVTNAGANGYGTVNNYGTLVVENGTYLNQKDSNASNFYNRKGGKATFVNPKIDGGGGCVATEVDTETTIYGGTYSDETYPAIENRGNMLITGGTFTNTSCSSCDGRWGYTIRSGEKSENAYLKIQGTTEDSVQVTGVQGGLAVIGGTADIYNGTYQTVACKTHTNGSSAFYAGYFTGESYKTATTIYGGTFQSCSKTAVLVGNGNPAPDSGAGKESTVMIKGGTFLGGDAAKTAITVNKAEHAVGAANITGGHFSSDVSQYLPSGMEQDSNGDVVAKEGAVARIGDAYYATLNHAIDAVKQGETITVVKDIPDATGISVPSGREFTIDFDGHTYTLTGPGAGSTNTETNGFQFLKDSTITLRNGTIRIAENANKIKRIIQNYADLTLENMQIYAENQVEGEDYSLSFNNGNITFKGNTSVYTSSDDTIAFDVCKYSSYPSVSVTFDESFTGTINGKICYDSPDAKTHTLTIRGNGTFGGITTTERAGEAAKEAIDVYGGTFFESVKEYVVEELNYELNNHEVYTYHKTFEDAFKHAGPNAVITPVRNAPSESYKVTFVYGNGTENKTISTVGNITLPAAPSRPGYTFTGWSDGANLYKAGESVKITSNTTFTAQWSDNTPYYAITVKPADNGTVTCYARSAAKGATVTVNVKPDVGYQLDKLVVTDAKGNVIEVKQESYGTYTFVMPGSKVTVEGVFVKTTPETLPFTDVKPTDWFYNSVKYVYENGLMNGVEGGQFAPNATLNRAMMVTILYRLDGQPAVSGDVSFTDVPAGTWYTNAVKWASDNGIVNGMEGNKFAPNGDLTREQMAAILYRYAEYKKLDVSASADLTAFVDGDKTSAWAADAMKWAVGSELINGLEGNTLAPQGTSTRAQVAAVLMRFCENIVK